MLVPGPYTVSRPNAHGEIIIRQAGGPVVFDDFHGADAEDREIAQRRGITPERMAQTRRAITRLHTLVGLTEWLAQVWDFACCATTCACCEGPPCAHTQARALLAYIERGASHGQ